MSKNKDIIVYGHSFCAAVPSIRKILRAAQAPYRYVDITLSPEGQKHVKQINNGNLSVPTLVFPDGSSLTEPDPLQIKNKLEANGYPVSALAVQRATRKSIFQSTSFWVTVVFVLYAILRALEVV
jgi:mycoredoxin